MGHYKISYLGDLRTECEHESGVKIQTDAPKDNQGKGEAFSPTDLIAVGMGSCMLTMMGLIAKRLGVDLKGARVAVEKEMANAPARRIGRISVQFFIPCNPSEEIRKKLEHAAMQCPVHYSLHPEIKQDIHFNWGSH